MANTREDYAAVFEEDEAVIKARLLANPNLTEWRKEPGDFVFDTVVPAAPEVQLLQIGQDTILKNAFPQYAEGEYMDGHLEEIGLARIAATPNQRLLTITADAGVVIPAGHTASVVILDDNGNPLEFTVDNVAAFDTAGTASVAVTSTTAGLLTNVATGTQFILLPPIPGVRSIVDAGVTIPGRDTETDAEAWDRYLFKVSNEDTGGNKNDYVRWAEDYEGVGKAKCIPRWNGNGTVKVVILGADFTGATPTVVNNLQAYLDPGSQGLGEGRAPFGAAVTVEAAGNLPINVVASVVLKTGYTLSQVRTSFLASLVAYLKDQAFEVDESTGQPYLVAYNQVAATLITTPGVMNWTSLTLNGGTVDISVGDAQAAVAGTVTLT
ncbi:baseplate J/gp47 family protein [Paenibacillus sp. FSL R5-0908]|uniref:baseplate J/gp47 family protein n=1 Tax=Paenibacillus sp. FSL R5-0908 TaxID=2921664 RepID=UPI0030F8CDCC